MTAPAVPSLLRGKPVIVSVIGIIAVIIAPQFGISPSNLEDDVFAALAVLEPVLLPILAALGLGGIFGAKRSVDLARKETPPEAKVEIERARAEIPPGHVPQAEVERARAEVPPGYVAAPPPMHITASDVPFVRAADLVSIKIPAKEAPEPARPDMQTLNDRMRDAIDRRASAAELLDIASEYKDESVAHGTAKPRPPGYDGALESQINALEKQLDEEHGDMRCSEPIKGEAGDPAEITVRWSRARYLIFRLKPGFGDLISGSIRAGYEHLPASMTGSIASIDLTHGSLGPGRHEIRLHGSKHGAASTYVYFVTIS